MFYITENTSPLTSNLDFFNSIILTNTEAKVNGGSFYVNNKGIEINMNTEV